tara:strand:+ start:735 stop:1130 length:396 start_codon:yes stop_codon:yes gene_type:complete
MKYLLLKARFDCIRDQTSFDDESAPGLKHQSLGLALYAELLDLKGFQNIAQFHGCFYISIHAGLFGQVLPSQIYIKQLMKINGAHLKIAAANGAPPFAAILSNQFLINKHSTETDDYNQETYDNAGTNQDI